jgi:hypothetical protein
MAKHRTAMGKTIDMAALAARNERVRAVGNMSVNARGDTIDSTGKIIKSATSKVNENYAKTVGNRSAQVTKKPVQKIQPDKPKVNLAELTPEEREFEEDDDFSAEVEAIKAKEQGKK